MKKRLQQFNKDRKRLEKSIRNYMENGDDYSARSYANLAETKEDKKYLFNLIETLLYNG